ncbi:peptidoglycan-binding domain-containing protein [Streptomyces poriticola]|uniref:peptidoglycan-binding domain-containing protein n=1 Tax=Streptomyces poriticola TaxID=3120506 RepID=UPI002FCE5877
MEQPERDGGRDRPGCAGHPCPECGAPRAPDRTPSCGCGARVSDALHEARTAQAAAAEDFDPLRIRPYVELGGPQESPDAEAGPGTPGDAPPGPPASPAAPAPPDPDATMPLRAVSAAPSDAASVLSAPLVPPENAPSATDLSLFESTAVQPAVAPDPAGAAAGRRRRGRRGALLGTAGAVVTVLGAAGYAGGLFAYETPSRDGALPEEVRASVPDAATGAASQVPAPSTASAPATPAAPSLSASASPSASASASSTPSASASSASPAPTGSAGPTPDPTTPAAGDGPDGSDDHRGRDGGHRGGQGHGDGPGDDDGTVLRRGDDGPEVAELQHRLAQLRLYVDDIDGRFGRRVEDAVRTYQWARGVRSDDPGDYGPETRRLLEGETREP